MTYSIIRKNFKYQNQVNQDILYQLKTIDISKTKQALSLLSHAINAHRLWNSRILNNKKKTNFIDYSIQDLVEMDHENFKDTMLVLEIGDLDKKIKYNNTSGQAYVNSIKDILTQVSQHFQYHRGQMISYLLSNHVVLRPTDYIYYTRKKQ